LCYAIGNGIAVYLEEQSGCGGGVEGIGDDGKGGTIDV